MLGLKVDQEVLDELVRIKVPAVWGLLQDHGVMWTLLVSRWFICLFIDVLPVEVDFKSLEIFWRGCLSVSWCCVCASQTVLRIWDCLFYEGSKILFRVALTLIHHHQDQILQAQNLPDVCERFKRITRGAFVEDCHAFMQVQQAHLSTSCSWRYNFLLSSPEDLQEQDVWISSISTFAVCMSFLMFERVTEAAYIWL